MSYVCFIDCCRWYTGVHCTGSIVQFMASDQTYLILLWRSFKDSSRRSFARSFALIRCFMCVRVLREVGLPHYTQISTWHLYLGWVCTCWRVWQCMFGMTESCAPSLSGIRLFELSQLNRCSFWATDWIDLGTVLKWDTPELWGRNIEGLSCSKSVTLDELS